MEIEKAFEIMNQCSSTGDPSIRKCPIAKSMYELCWTYPGQLKFRISVSLELLKDEPVLTVMLVKKVHEFEIKAEKFLVGG